MAYTRRETGHIDRNESWVVCRRIGRIVCLYAYNKSEQHNTIHNGRSSHAGFIIILKNGITLSEWNSSLRVFANFEPRGLKNFATRETKKRRLDVSPDDFVKLNNLVMGNLDE
jgi:hypothetical protein